MGVWSFKKQFAPAILSGTKKSTIRAYRKDGRDPKVGETCRIYSGMRTKSCEFIGQVKVLDRRRITVNAGLQSISLVQGEGTKHQFYFTAENHVAEQIALHDGFESLQEFFAFFKRQKCQVVTGFLYEFALAGKLSHSGGCHDAG